VEGFACSDLQFTNHECGETKNRTKRTHHGEYMFLLIHQTLHQHRSCAVILQELLHLRGKLVGIMASDGMYTHRPGEEDEVRVRHPCVRVAGVVEKV